VRGWTAKSMKAVSRHATGASEPIRVGANSVTRRCAKPVANICSRKQSHAVN
jgi:hypothetical protein